MESLIRGACTQCALHMRVDDLQTVNVAGIDPAKAVRYFRQPPESCQRFPMNLPFSSDPFEVDPLVAILNVDFVRRNGSCDIILLDDDTIKLYKGLCDHVQPLVR